MKQETVRFLNSSVDGLQDLTFHMSVEIKDRKALHAAMKSTASPVPAGTSEAESLQSFLQWMHLRLRTVVEGACFQPFEDGFTITALTSRQIFDLATCWISRPWIFDLYRRGISIELTNAWTLTRSGDKIELIRHDAVNGTPLPSKYAPQPAAEFSSTTDKVDLVVAAAGSSAAP